MNEVMGQKQRAGEAAAALVQDGMTVGLGTGTTAYWAIRRLGERVQEGLQIRAVPTSVSSEQLATQFGIPLVPLTLPNLPDLTIDGADEISPTLDLIKGRGGALLREKIVAAASRQFVVVADESKLVAILGRHPLPVEVVQFGWEVTAQRLADLKCTPQRRSRDGKPYVTENSNFILDCDFTVIARPGILNEAIKHINGVVETGLFVGIADKAIIGTSTGIKVIESQSAADF